MKCSLPDCNNRFSGQNKKEYSLLKFRANQFLIDKDTGKSKTDHPVKIKICKSCSNNRPLKEVIDVYLNQDGKGGLSESEAEAIKDSNFLLDIDKALGEQ